jgi:hypothetical protein
MMVTTPTVVQQTQGGLHLFLPGPHTVFVTKGPLVPMAVVGGNSRGAAPVPVGPHIVFVTKGSLVLMTVVGGNSRGAAPVYVDTVIMTKGPLVPMAVVAVPISTEFKGGAAPKSAGPHTVLVTMGPFVRMVVVAVPVSTEFKGGGTKTFRALIPSS